MGGRRARYETTFERLQKLRKPFTCIVTVMFLLGLCRNPLIVKSFHSLLSMFHQ